MRLPVAFISALAAVGSVPTALARMEFLSPPEFSGSVEPSSHPVLAVGTPLKLVWTPAEEGKKLSVMLYQLDATRAADFDGRFRPSDVGSAEYITHDQVDATSFTWFVGTEKDLSISPMFAIAVWQGGRIVTDSATNIFNITNPAAETTSSAVSSTSSTSSSSSTTTSATTSTSSSSPGVTPGDTPGNTPGDGGAGLGAGSDSAASDQSAPAGLSTGAAAGVGVGAAFAGMLLVGLAWYLRSRWVKKRPDMAQAGFAPVATEYHEQPAKDYYHYTPPVEAPLEPYRRHELSSAAP